MLASLSSSTFKGRRVYHRPASAINVHLAGPPGREDRVARGRSGRSRLVQGLDLVPKSGGALVGFGTDRVLELLLQHREALGAERVGLARAGDAADVRASSVDALEEVADVRL